MLVLGAAELGPPARASWETAGDSKGVGQNSWGSRVAGAWQGGRPVDTGLLVEAGLTEPALRRKVDRANWTWVSISNGRTAAHGGREQKMCHVRPQPGRGPSETHTGPTGLKGDK